MFFLSNILRREQDYYVAVVLKLVPLFIWLNLDKTAPLPIQNLAFFILKFIYQIITKNIFKNYEQILAYIGFLEKPAAT